MSPVALFRRQSHPTRGLQYNLRRLLAPRSRLAIELHEQDLRFSLPVTSIFARLLYKYGEYERPVSNWLIQHHSAWGDGLFVDVGANFGWYACLLSRLDRSRRILAFEPEPGNFTLLQTQLALNQAHNVQALNKGLGLEPGRLEMFKYKEGNSGRHSLLPLHEGERVSVEIVTLDAQLEAMRLDDQPIAFMKMDIEGYEWFALRGAERALSRTQRLILEFSPELMRKAQLNPDDLLDLLANQRFVPRLFDSLSGGEPQSISFDELRERGRQDIQVDLLLERPNNAPGLGTPVGRPSTHRPAAGSP